MNIDDAPRDCHNAHTHAHTFTRRGNNQFYDYGGATVSARVAVRFSGGVAAMRRLKYLPD